MRFYKYCVILLALSLLSACISIQRNPVPAEFQHQVSVLGRQDLRFWGDKDQLSGWLNFTALDSQEIAEQFPAVFRTEHNYLAISGGGENGAYGAGVLVGWSEMGTRPQFSMVTGVSTGALTAPFAFLGSDYDAQLQELYTTLDSSRIFRLRSLFNIISGGDSMADVEPLIKLLEKYITPGFVAKIAAQYRLGRSLQIGTTNLDSGRPVIWNIGRIADSGHKDSAALIRQVMLASASIPGIFPPVYIKVKGPDGKFYDEMHVDGGTTAQIFLYPSFNNWAEVAKKLEVTGRPKAYLIRNSRTDDDYDPVTPKIRSILVKSVSTMIRSQGVGDLYRIHSLAQRDEIDLQITWIPAESVDVKSEQVFDPKYMSALFDFGKQRVKQPGFWVDPVKLLKIRQEALDQ